MAKKTKRWVYVDMSYNISSDWVRALVIDKMMAMDLFTGEPTRERLLVEFPGGERRWIGFWEDKDPEM